MTDEGKPQKSGRAGSRGPGMVGWLLGALFIVLAVFYGWRTESNRAQLTDRNLRELDRIGRTLEGRTASYAMIVRGLRTRDTAFMDMVVGKQRVPGLLGRTSCAKKPRGLSVQGNAIAVCYSFESSNPRRTGSGGRATSPPRRVVWPDTLGVLFGVEPLRQALDTALFDASFVATDSGSILMIARGRGVRVRAIAADSGREAREPASRVRTVTLGGRDYLMFLQPLAIQPAALAGATPSRPATWWVGGLVSTARFRGESLALEPPHLVFLGLLLLLVLLSLPYLRVALMGPAESVRVSDVHLLSLALMLAGGALGVAIANEYFLGAYTMTLDRNLVAAADRLAGAYHDEIGAALGELGHWREVFDTAKDGRNGPRDRTGILDSVAADINRDPARKGAFLRERYLTYQTIVWVSPEGEQKARWTPRAENTFPVSVRDRAYFRRIVDDSTFRWRKDAGSPAWKYAAESINSMTTGEKLAAIAVPYCWKERQDAPRPADVRIDPGAGCDSLGAEVLFTRPLSLDRPVLPPGILFAVVDPAGLTLFHSDPQRDLAENFIEETGRNPLLRAALAAQREDTLDATYMGRRSRVYVRPLEGTPYSLALVLDKSPGGTARFESVCTSLIVFFAFALLLWLAIVALEHVLPGHLRWAWPVLGQRRKYVRLAWLLAAFGAVQLLEAVGSAILRIPVHPGAFMVPLQALAVVLLVQAAAIGKGWGRSRRWADPRVVGWVVLAFVSGVQVGSHVNTLGNPGWFDTVVGLLQFGVATGAAWTVLRLPSAEEAGKPVALPYVAAGVGAVLVVAVLPAYLLYQEAFSTVEERLVRFEQVHWLGELRERTHRIQARASENRLPPVADTLLLADGLDRAVPPVFGARWQDAARVACVPQRSAIQEQVFSRVRTLVPFVTNVAVSMRDIGDDVDGARWERCAHGLVQLRAGRDTLRTGLAAGVRTLPPSWLALLTLLVGGGLIALYLLVRWLARRVFLLDLPAFAPVYLRDPHAGAGDSGEAADRLLVICTPAFRPSALPREGADYYLDLQDVPHERARLADALKPAARGHTLVLDHVDRGLDDPTWRAALLETLEELVYLHGRRLVLLMEHEPGALFPLDEHAELPADDVTARWIRLLGQLVKISAAGIQPPVPGAGRVPRGPGAVPADRPARHPRLVRVKDWIQRRWRGLERWNERWLRWLAGFLTLPSGIELPAPPETGPVSGAEASLDQECPAENDRLAEVRREIERRYEVDTLTEDGVLDQVRESADPYYRALWAGLEREEKLVVAQLAANVVVNPKSRRAVRRLLTRGVLVRRPELRLMNESFARFVREEVPAEAIRAWEEALPWSAWQRLRFPIILALAAVAAFLFATQRETFDMVLAIVTGVGVASTAVVRLVGGLKGEK